MEGDGELGFAGLGGIVESRAFAAAFGGAEKESLPGSVGQAREAGFAVGIGADLEIELVEVHESVGDVDLNGGGIDWLGSIVGDGEIGRAGADAAIDDGDGFRIGRRRSLGRGRS